MYCVAERASPSDAFRVYFVSSEGVLQQRAAEGVERHISPVRVRARAPFVTLFFCI